MKKLKIAYSENALQAFGAVDGREIIDVNNTDYTDVAAVVITEQDSDVLKNEMIGAFKIPVMLIKDADSHLIGPRCTGKDEICLIRMENTRRVTLGL